MAQPAHGSRVRIKAETLSAGVASAISEVEEFVLARQRKQGAVTDMLDFEKGVALLRRVGTEQVRSLDLPEPRFGRWKGVRDLTVLVA